VIVILAVNIHPSLAVVKVRGNAGERRSWAPKNCWQAFPTVLTTGLTTGCIVYTNIQPVVFENRLYRVNGALLKATISIYLAYISIRLQQVVDKTLKAVSRLHTVKAGKPVYYTGCQAICQCRCPVAGAALHADNINASCQQPSFYVYRSVGSNMSYRPIRSPNENTTKQVTGKPSVFCLFF